MLDVLAIHEWSNCIIMPFKFDMQYMSRSEQLHEDGKNVLGKYVTIYNTILSVSSYHSKMDSSILGNN